MRFSSFVVVLLLFTSVTQSQEKLELLEEYQNQTALTVESVYFESLEGSISWKIGDAAMILVIDNDETLSDLEDDVTFSTYPNPSIDILHINCHAIDKEPFTVTFYDLFGRAVLSKKLYNKQSEVNVQGLPATLYAVVLTNTRGQFVKSFKLIKR